MKPTINIENYEEIMFRLVEDDFNTPTRVDLLQQIEADELFKFEWESWQKTKFADLLENYSDESRELTEKIILIAEPKISDRKRIIYYWAAAASIILLIGTLYLLTGNFTSSPKPEVVEIVKESPAPLETATPQVQNQTVPVVFADQQQFRNQKSEITILPVAADSNTIVQVDKLLAESPLLLDSVPIKANELAKAPEKKPRYTITIETSDIIGNTEIGESLAHNRNRKLSKVLTNTRLILSRNPNGEPEKLFILGEENNYLCINLNYSEK